MSHTRLIDELREKYPGLSAFSRTQGGAAIRLFCLECMGGVPSEVKACTDLKCALYTFRLRKKEGVQDGG